MSVSDRFKPELRLNLQGGETERDRLSELAERAQCTIGDGARGEHLAAVTLTPEGDDFRKDGLVIFYGPNGELYAENEIARDKILELLGHQG